MQRVVGVAVAFLMHFNVMTFHRCDYEYMLFFFLVPDHTRSMYRHVKFYGGKKCEGKITVTVSFLDLFIILSALFCCLFV